MSQNCPQSIESYQATLLANIGWEEAKSVPMAQAFVAAALAWLVLSPSAVGNQGYSVTLNPAAVQAQVDRAKTFLALSGMPQVRYLVPWPDWRGEQGWGY